MLDTGHKLLKEEAKLNDMHDNISFLFIKKLNDGKQLCKRNKKTLCHFLPYMSITFKKPTNDG